MFVTVWEYEVRAGAESAFEALYGERGPWVALFRDHAGYLGTQLLHGERQGHYLTLDRWCSAQDYTAMQLARDPRYAALDAQGDALTTSERHLGSFTAPDAG